MKINIKDLCWMALVVAACCTGYALKSNPPIKQASSPSYVPDPVFMRKGDVKFNVSTFRNDIENLTEADSYAEALNLLILSSSDELIEHHGHSYCVIDEAPVLHGCSFLLPGTQAAYVQGRDWIFPKTGENVGSSAHWPTFCELFAEKYNRRVDCLNKIKGTGDQKRN